MTRAATQRQKLAADLSLCQVHFDLKSQSLVILQTLLKRAAFKFCKDCQGLSCKNSCWCYDILSTGQFVNLHFCQFTILSICHFVNLPFYQFDIYFYLMTSQDGSLLSRHQQHLQKPFPPTPINTERSMHSRPKILRCRVSGRFHFQIFNRCFNYSTDIE